MRELELRRLSKIKNRHSVMTVDDVIKRVISKSPRLDMNRKDMQRGKTYYVTGGDPDRRSQI